MTHPDEKVADQVTEIICKALDRYYASEQPELTVCEILMALERIRFALTEGVLKYHQRTRH